MRAWKSNLLSALLAVAGLSLDAAKPADEWRPVICDSTKPYRGPKLHAPPGSPVFKKAAGALDGSLDSATIGRLEAALKKAVEATKAPSMTVAVGVPGQGSWTSTTNRGTETNSLMPRWFWFASVGKTSPLSLFSNWWRKRS